MLTVHTIDELRHWVGRWHRDELRVALVPTMGALHEGHLRLIEAGLQEADRVVVSVFVNPAQFGEGEDFDAYPRVLEDDAAKLSARGAHLLFAPPVDAVYPGGVEQATYVEVPELSNMLCGAHRPGHFRGVATVVAKLFNMVQPDVAVFGEKDFQQLAVIRRLTADLNFPVEIVGYPTVREPDGVAMSSRNAYLTDEERARAPTLYQVLSDAAGELAEGADPDGVAAEAHARLEQAGFRPDYVSVRRAEDLAPPQAGDTALVVLAAAWLGRARLIDNVTVARVKPKP